MEMRRSAAVDELTHGLDASRTALTDSIAAIRERNQTECSSLCGGVSSMLDKGRNTCSVLKRSIEEALTTLIGDAATAKVPASRYY